MEVVINTPIQLKLSVVEIENVLPSFKLHIELDLESNFLDIKYNYKNAWINCNNWDNFINELQVFNEHSSNEALLNDLSNYFSLKLINKNGKIHLNVSLQKSGMSYGDFQINYEGFIDLETFYLFRNKFLEFEKWW
jgi:hypothetical protein